MTWRELALINDRQRDMTETVETHVAKIGIRLVDDVYTAWEAAEGESAQALRAWFDRAFRHDELYTVYLAALDREEAAALDLERLAKVAVVCSDVLTDPGAGAEGCSERGTDAGRERDRGEQ
jgi:hypothetical protein